MTFIVRSPDGLHIWGPFATANEAVDWVLKQGDAIPKGWNICMLKSPN